MAPGPDHIKRLMAGFEAAVAGRSLAGLPPELAEALAKYSGQSVTLGLRQGKPEALSRSPALLADERADRTKQLQLLQILGEVRRPACVPIVLRLACQSPDNALRSAALGALAGYDDPAIPVEVIKAYANMSDDVLAAAQSLLVTRRAWATRFLEAIEGHDDRCRDSFRARSSRSCCFWATRESTRAGDQAVRTDQAGHLGRAARPDRPAGRRDPRRLGVPKPGKQIFDSSACAAMRSSARGARSGPTSPPTAATTWRRCS